MSVEEKNMELDALLAFPESLGESDIIKVSNLAYELDRSMEAFFIIFDYIVPSKS